MLNKSIVKIELDTISSGTGFMIRDDGWLATCRHVIEPLKYTDSLGRVRIRHMYAIFNNGEKVEVGIFNHQLLDQTGYDDSQAYDFVMLKLETKPEFEYRPLRLGKWDDVNDGDEVYTAGFPVSINNRIISKGLLSSKWIQKIPLYKSTGELLGHYDRNVAWVDMTSNKGNSGGPVIKIGRTPEEDRVIGIASFILNPAGNEASQVYNFYRNLKRKNDNRIGLNDQMEILFKSASYNSIGISGVISSDYLSELLSKVSR